jgi:protease II
MESRDLSTDTKIVKPRLPGVEYFVEHAHDRFYILTNCGHNGEYQVQ